MYTDSNRVVMQARVYLRNRDVHFSLISQFEVWERKTPTEVVALLSDAGVTLGDHSRGWGMRDDHELFIGALTGPWDDEMTPIGAPVVSLAEVGCRCRRTPSSTLQPRF